MQTTTDSPEAMTPARTSWIAPASVAPPAGSVNTPSVSASSSIACRISSSLDATPVPPVAFTVRTTWNPSAGFPIAIDFAMVDGFGELQILLERPDDGRTSGRLRGMDAWQLTVDESDLAQFAEAAKNSRQECSARDRRNQVLRKTPAELLGHFEPDGLRPFGVVAAQVDVCESPAELVCDLRAQTIDVVVVAAHADDVRPEDRGPEHFSELEIVGNEDIALQAQACRVRGDAVGQISSRRAAKHGEAQFDGPGCRHRHDAILVGQRRMVYPVFLNVELLQAEMSRQPIRANQRCITGLKTRPGLTGNGQQLSKPPYVSRPPLDRITTHRVAYCAVIVFNFQRSQALIADPQRLGGKLRPAQVALQPRHKRHASPSRCTLTVLTVQPIRSRR